MIRVIDKQEPMKILRQKQLSDETRRNSTLRDSACLFSLFAGPPRRFFLNRRCCWLVLSLFVLAVAGCGLFSTREPESPTGSQGQSELALRADEVFDLTASAIAVRDPELYLNMISPGFAYTSMPGTSSDPTLFDVWSFNDESNFIRGLLSPSLLPVDSLARLEYPETLVEQIWPDSAYFRVVYRLELHTTSEEIPALFEGQMSVTVVRGEDNGWRIHHWTDEVRQEGGTFSELRAIL